MLGLEVTSDKEQEFFNRRERRENGECVKEIRS